MSQQIGKNPVTGNPVIITTGILKSWSREPLTNKNGKKYRVVTAQIENRHGVKETYTGFMNEANFAYGVEVGESYQTRLEKTDRPNPLVIVSHLKAGMRATNDAFDWNAGEFIDLATPRATAMGTPAEALAVKESVK